MIDHLASNRPSQEGGYTAAKQKLRKKNKMPWCKIRVCGESTVLVSSFLDFLEKVMLNFETEFDSVFDLSRRVLPFLHACVEFRS